MENCKTAPTPATTSLNQIEDTTSEKIKVSCRELIGALLYLAIQTRPDIGWAVVAVARHSEKPKQIHWSASKRILRYLKGTRELGITYGMAKTVNKMHGYVDSDFAGDAKTRKSTTGYIFRMNGAAIDWQSKLQPNITLTSTEAEYVAAATAAREATYLQGLLSDLDLKQIPTTLYEDNQGCIAMTKAECANKRTKHIDVKHKYANELVSNQTIRLGYLPTDEMAADILTKPLTGENYITHCSTLLGTDSAHRGGVLERGRFSEPEAQSNHPKGKLTLLRRTKMTGSSKGEKGQNF